MHGRIRFCTTSSLLCSQAKYHVTHDVGYQRSSINVAAVWGGRKLIFLRCDKDINFRCLSETVIIGLPHSPAALNTHQETKCLSTNALYVLLFEEFVRNCSDRLLKMGLLTKMKNVSGF